jgi:RNA polymerase sigma-70 factor (ECF subfamily)
MFKHGSGEEKDLLQAGYRYALSLTHHQHDAEDVVQTACLKIYSRYGRIKNKPLLFKTIRNLFFDQQRRDKLIQFQVLDNHQEIAAGSTSSPETLSQTADLESLLGALRPEEREVLYLNAVEGYSAREIAKLSGQSRNTVLSLLHRGKQKLQNAASDNSDQ